MTSMRAVTIDLNEGAAAFIEREVLAGRAESLQAYITTAVERTIVFDLVDETDDDSPEFQAFLAECDETARRIDEGLEPTYPLEEVMERLRLNLEDRRHAARPAAE